MSPKDHSSSSSFPITFFGYQHCLYKHSSLPKQTRSGVYPSCFLPSAPCTTQVHVPASLLDVNSIVVTSFLDILPLCLPKDIIPLRSPCQSTWHLARPHTMLLSIPNQVTGPLLSLLPNDLRARPLLGSILPFRRTAILPPQAAMLAARAASMTPQPLEST